MSLAKQDLKFSHLNYDTCHQSNLTMSLNLLKIFINRDSYQYGKTNLKVSNLYWNQI